MLSHLDHPRNYARLLFIDCSLAFNTIIPNILIKKLLDLHLNKELITDFRRNSSAHTTHYLNGVCVERVSSIKILGVHIS